MGFGGEDLNDFRLFLDTDLLSKSYSNDSDRTFSYGPLTDSAT